MKFPADTLAIPDPRDAATKVKTPIARARATGAGNPTEADEKFVRLLRRIARPKESGGQASS